MLIRRICVFVVLTELVLHKWVHQTVKHWSILCLSATAQWCKCFIWLEVSRSICLTNLNHYLSSILFISIIIITIGNLQFYLVNLWIIPKVRKMFESMWVKLGMKWVWNWGLLHELPGESQRKEETKREEKRIDVRLSESER